MSAERRQGVIYESTIPFRARLRHVALVSPSATLPPLVLPRPPEPPAPEPPPPPPPPAPPAPSVEVDKHEQKERDSIERALATMMEVARDLKAEQGKRLGEMQVLAVELAVAIGAQLTHERIESGDFAVETLVHKVVGKLDTEQAITVYLHPEDIALLERRRSGQVLFPNSADIRLVPDPSFRRGDCRAESGDLIVLSRLEDQLTAIHRRLFGRLADAEAERHEAEPRIQPS